MWCACNCGEHVRPSDFHVKDETTGTNVYYVDRGHYLSTDPWGFQRYSQGSLDNLYDREMALPDDEHYMSGWFAREHGRAWGDERTSTPKIKRALRATLKAWNEWRKAHGLEPENHLPV
jgi:hypothetical protein